MSEEYRSRWIDEMEEVVDGFKFEIDDEFSNTNEDIFLVEFWIEN